jgi:hypothetical protein
MRATGAFLAMALVAACFIDRKTTDFECTTTDDCAGDLVCRDNYCVVDEGTDGDDVPIECPPDCRECDPRGNECLILCTTNDRCGDIECPAGWACQILCQGSQACGDITCEDGPCEVQCVGANACETIDCRRACACDVLCDDQACDDAICPIADGRNCTDDGTTETGCTSSPPDCNQCN